MAFFGSKTPAAASPSTDIKTQIQQQISQELAVANATQLVNKLSENCFDKCVEVPESTLTAQQDACISMCMQKYMRSWNVISKKYVERIQQTKV